MYINKQYPKISEKLTNLYNYLKTLKYITKYNIDDIDYEFHRKITRLTELFENRDSTKMSIFLYKRNPYSLKLVITFHRNDTISLKLLINFPSCYSESTSFSFQQFEGIYFDIKKINYDLQKIAETNVINQNADNTENHSNIDISL